jgi:hypothetical protein
MIINQVFLLLDYIIFPWFLKYIISKPVFIVSAPRSGTTFLFHKMADVKAKFTCFKLWEILFAPSIIQKYIFIGIRKIDQLLFSPIYRSVLFFENILIGNLKKAHKISLTMPEEDEGLLIWYLYSPFLEFFYADSGIFEDLSYFDERVNTRSKKWIMKKYLNLVKRHNFVFNRKGQKQFLSKNPFMMPKLQSLKQTFPDARVITIDRCPLKTIPSALSLSEKLYGFFTTVTMTSDMRKHLINALIHWHKSSRDSLGNFYQNDFVRIDFNKLIKWDVNEINKLSDLISYDLNQSSEVDKVENSKHKSQSKYEALSTEESNFIMKELDFMKATCQDL